MYILLLIFLVSPKGLYTEAKTAYEKGNFELASKKFERFLVNYPKTEHTPLVLYYAAILRRKSEDVLNYYEKLSSNHPKSKIAPNALYDIAQYYYALEEYQKALKTHKKIISSYPNSVSAKNAKKQIKKLTSFIFIQIGYFSTQENACRLTNKLKELHPRVIKEGKHYRVWVGPFSSSEEAKNFMLQNGLKGITKKMQPARTI